MVANHPIELFEKVKRKHRHFFLGIWVIAILIFLSVHFIFQIPVQGIIIFFLLSSGVLFFLFKSHKPDLDSIIRLTHRQNPGLEYSTALLLQSPQSSSLATLQRIRVEQEFSNFDFKISITRSLLLQISALLLTTFLSLFLYWQYLEKTSLSNTSEVPSGNKTGLMFGEQDTTYISNFKMGILPPRYTLLPSRVIVDPQNVEVVEGTSIKWELESTGSIEDVFFIFGNGDTTSISESMTVTKTLQNSTFYKYGFSDSTGTYSSDYFNVKVIADNRPKVAISGLEEYERLPMGKGS